MTKAYRCDRCRECYDGVPKEELRFEGSGETKQLCEACYEELEKFLEQSKKEGGDGPVA